MMRLDTDLSAAASDIVFTARDSIGDAWRLQSLSTFRAQRFNSRMHEPLWRIASRSCRCSRCWCCVGPALPAARPRHAYSIATGDFGFTCRSAFSSRSESSRRVRSQICHEGLPWPFQRSKTPWICNEQIPVPKTSAKPRHYIPNPEYTALLARFKTEYESQVPNYKLLNNLSEAEMKRTVGPKNRRVEEMTFTSPSMPICDALTILFHRNMLLGKRP